MKGPISVDRFVRAAANDVQSEDEDCLVTIERIIEWLDEVVDDLPKGTWKRVAHGMIQVYEGHGGVD